MGLFQFDVKMLMSLVLLGFIGLLVRLYNGLVEKPKKLRSLLTKQGISGPPPTLLLGNIMEEIMKSRGSSNVFREGEAPTTHNCAALLFPFFEKWRKQYAADIILWRNKQISAYVFVGATLTWLLFERTGYNLVVFVCHASLLSLTALFLWSNLGSFIYVSPSEILETILPQHLFMRTAISLTATYNQALRSLRHVVFGTNIRDFLSVAVVLWVLPVVGRLCSFLSFLYVVFVILMIVPALYDNLEDSVDSFAEKALIAINKQYAALDEKVIQKLKESVISSKNRKQQ